MPVHNSAQSAWKYLEQLGGLEPEGRDAQLVEMLRGRLSPDAATVEEGLQNVSMEGFLNAFFGVISPFLGMMRDLLQYFESAGATEGPGQWQLVLGEGADELKVNLDHFRQWIKTGERSIAGQRMVPILDRDGMWKINQSFNPLGRAHKDAIGQTFYEQARPQRMSNEMLQWLAAYERGEYISLPGMVYDCSELQGPMGDVAVLLLEHYSAVTTLARTRRELEAQKERLRANDAGEDQGNPLGIWGVESDLWPRNVVLNIGAWAEAATVLRSQVEASLAALFEDLPRRSARWNVQIEDLEDILSLPIWQRRYELYSAWILTLMLKALRGHDVELHHDSGRIDFAFRESLMASILSSVEPMRILAEKRVAATGLIGHGRLGGVQPDYSVWTDADVCRLAVECKQYKDSSTRNFADALTDYSHALSVARIVLANYGPVGPRVMENVDPRGRSRCQALGGVHPEGPKECAEFQKWVRQAIGEPDPLKARTTLNLAERGERSVLLIDVSGSMRRFLASEAATQLIEKLMEVNGIERVVTADDRLRGESGAVMSEIRPLLDVNTTGSTNLHAVIETKLSHANILIVTDEDGLKTLGIYRPTRSETLKLNGFSVCLASVRLG